MELTPGRGFGHITLPLLRSTLTFVIVMTMLSRGRCLFSPMLWTNRGGPANATRHPGVAHLRNAFRNQENGTGRHGGDGPFSDYFDYDATANALLAQRMGVFEMVTTPQNFSPNHRSGRTDKMAQAGRSVKSVIYIILITAACLTSCLFCGCSAPRSSHQPKSLSCRPRSSLKTLPLQSFQNQSSPTPRTADPFLPQQYSGQRECGGDVLFTSSLAGFVFAKYQFFGKDALFTLILATMMIPSR